MPHPDHDIWIQSLRGRAIDLLDPKAEDVDLRETADTLATVNRYSGAAEKPVSTAHHTLIACDAAPTPRLKALMLVHDLHEDRIGDITTPVADALAAIAAQKYGPHAAVVVKGALAELKRRHDAAIFQAAGVPLPTPQEHAAMRHADVAAMMTERRDFMAAPPRPWQSGVEAVRPLPRRYTFRAPGDVADELFRRFEIHFPALARPGRGAA